MAADRSDEVARLLAAVEDAADDRELVDRFVAVTQSPDLDAETRRAFGLEAIATGLTARVNAALDRVANSAVEAIREAHKRPGSS